MRIIFKFLRIFLVSLLTIKLLVRFQLIFNDHSHNILGRNPKELTKKDNNCSKYLHLIYGLIRNILYFESQQFEILGINFPHTLSVVIGNNIVRFI